MKIQTKDYMIECDASEVEVALATLGKLIALANPNVATIGTPSVAQRMIGTEERALRDKYASEYGKGFSMKGKAGNPLEILRALRDASWPKSESATLDVAPMTESFGVNGEATGEVY